MNDDAVTTVKKSPTGKKRRVGTLSAGITMIGVGILILLATFSEIDLTKLAAVAPIVLIMLGLELIASYIFFGREDIKFDFLSAFICFFLCVIMSGIALIPIGTRLAFYNEQLESRIQSEARGLLTQKLSSVEGISGFWTGTYINESAVFEDNTDNITPENLADKNLGGVTLQVTLFDNFESTHDFALKCGEVIAALGDSTDWLEDIRFFTADGEDYSLSLSGMQYGLDADELSRLVTYFPVESESPAAITDECPVATTVLPEDLPEAAPTDAATS